MMRLRIWCEMKSTADASNCILFLDYEPVCRASDHFPVMETFLCVSDLFTWKRLRMRWAGWKPNERQTRHKVRGGEPD